MKKYWHIWMMILCCSLVFTGCGKDDDVVVDEEWKQENEAAFDAIAKNPEYKELKSLGNNGSIYYKVLKEGVGKESPYFTSTIKAYYTGEFINGDIFDSHEPPYQTTATFNVKEVVQGWTTALQYMHVGDRWEIWIPYNLGYGESDYKKNGVVIVPGYSTLKFEIELVEIVTQ